MDDPTGPVRVFESGSRRDANEFALVLEARGIAYSWHEDGRAFQLVVDARDAAAARAELFLYSEERRGWPPREADFALVSARGTFASLVYAVTICAAWLMQSAHAFGIDWTAHGIASAARIRDGAWWRAFTALTLHADVPHLAGNVVFGALFIAGVAQVLGNGVTLIAVLLAGGAGNALNAWIQAPAHTSLGASTAAFGAVGMLGAVLFMRRAHSVRGRLFRWTPPTIALIILGYLGVAGERTDVMAHVLGAAAGAAIGAVCGAMERAALLRRTVQNGAAAVAAYLLVFAWWRALR